MGQTIGVWFLEDVGTYFFTTSSTKGKNVRSFTSILQTQLHVLSNLCSSQIIHFIKIHSPRTNLLQAATKEKVHTLVAQQLRNITAGQIENCCEWSGYSPSSWTGSHSLGNTLGTRIPRHVHGLPQLWCMNGHPWSAPSVRSWNCHWHMN